MNAKRQRDAEGLEASPAMPPPARRPAKAEVERSRASVWRRRLLTIAMASLAIVMAYGVVFGHNGLTAFARKREESRQLDQQRMQLDRENDRLRGHVERLASDPDAIEHQAREELHYTHADEVIITLPKAKAQ